MKIYSKKELEFKGGYLVAPDGEVLNNSVLVEQVNLYKELLYFCEFLENNREAIEDSQKGSVVYSMHKEYPPVVIEAETPVLDKQIEDKLALFREIKGQSVAKEISEASVAFKDLIEFAKTDDVVLVHDTIAKFDIDPLTVSYDEICEVLRNRAELDDLAEAVVIEDED